ncbi:MAG: hypothetical protein JWO58_2963 [Chitinophagaceae bacterium]|nr:hypothetical protein [Chitinophagaceae bacterium]
MSRTRLDLLERFEEQIQNLLELCSTYDSGSEIVSLSIATSIRVFLHDTSKSHSLFSQLNLKSVDFFNTANIEWEFHRELPSGERPVHFALCHKLIDPSTGSQIYSEFYKRLLSKNN